ncbi:MAG TPA: hypothetical protein VIO32_01910 [Candidatus Baltobacteraceae bacterium]
MMRVPPFFARDDRLQVALDVARRLAQRESEPVSHAKDVRVDGDLGFFKRHRHNHARRFSADAGQRFQLLAFARHLASVFFDQFLGTVDDVPRLRPEKAARLDDALDVLLPGLGKFFGGRIFSEQDRRRHIHARVGALRREYHRDDQFERIGVFERGFGMRIRTLENAKLFERDVL